GPTFAAFFPHSEDAWITRWYVPAGRPASGAAVATATPSPSVCEKITAPAFIFEPLIGASSARARHCWGGGGSGGSSGSSLSVGSTSSQDCSSGSGVSATIGRAPPPLPPPQATA